MISKDQIVSACHRFLRLNNHYSRKAEAENALAELYQLLKEYYAEQNVLSVAVAEAVKTKEKAE